MCVFERIYSHRKENTHHTRRENTMKKQNYTEIEARIEERISELEEEYELDTYDIQEIRDEEYRLGGWSYDPFPEIEEEEEEEWHYRSLEQQLNEVGMSMRDFL
nr:MAG TPA: hypothetical protein [Caudoviricetes sp.]